MAKAIRFHKTGGPEVMQLEEVAVGEPAAGQARIRQTAIGVNFIDTYQRSGLYPMPLPSGLGSEAAGVIEAVGPGVAGLKPGDRVAYTGNPVGSYAEARLYPADRLVKIPEGVTDQQAACMMLKGMTVQYLIHRTFKAKPGDTVLWHAAAGGVGLIACQWLKALGVNVIGTVGSDAKIALAKKVRVRPRHQLFDRELHPTREGDNRWQRRAGRLRLGGQEHLGRVARLPAAARPDGVVRQCLGPGGASQHRHLGAKGIAVSHASHAGQLHGHAH